MHPKTAIMTCVDRHPMISRPAILSLAALAGITASAVFASVHPLDALDQALLGRRPVSPERAMPVFAHIEDDAGGLIAFTSGVGLDLQKLVHDDVGENAAYPVNCSRAICRISRSAHI